MPVKNFEDVTYNVTDFERGLLTILRAMLEDHHGKSNAITANQITSYFKTLGYKVDGPRVRKLINAMRTEFSELRVLVATSKGYYWETDKAEIEAYLESLTNRYNEIRRVHYHIKRAYIKLNPVKLNEGLFKQ